MESPEESNCEFGNCKRPPSLLSVQDFGSSTLQKRDAAHPLYGISHSLLLCHKHFFSHTTDWANPVFRKIFKCCSRCDSVVRITHLRVIYISAWFTNIFLHFIFSFLPEQIVRINNLHFSGKPHTSCKSGHCSKQRPCQRVSGFLDFCCHKINRHRVENCLCTCH